MQNFLNKLLIGVVFFSFSYSKYPDAVGVNGMVVSSNDLATEIGVNILKDGGNAVDAAVAVGFALAVTHPGAGNIGGGGFMVIRFSDGTSTSIDFRETAPALADKDMFLDVNGNVVKGKSWNTALAVGVPGSVAGFGYAHDKYGSKRWSDLIQPSVKLARYGYQIGYLNYNLLNSTYYRKYLSSDKETKKIFYKDEGFKLNEVFVQKDLAKTLSRIASYGYRDFYEGQISKKIIKCMNRTGGIISYNDLKNYMPVERNPIVFNYRDNKVITMPPSSSGGIVLAQILNQLENFNINEFNFHGLKHIHYMSEIERRAYADRAEVLGDSDFIDIPIDSLISDSYAKIKVRDIDCCKASISVDIEPFNSKYYESEETTHYSVVDKWGNAVSVTTTINGWYGSGITVDEAGFLLNNEMDDFSIKPGYPNKYGLVGSWANSIAPNKRMLSSMTPTIIEDSNGDLLAIIGSPGGSTIITTIAQIISNIIDFKMPLKDAVEAPRTHHQWLPDKIFLESNFLHKSIYDDLLSLNHTVDYKQSIGEANCIMYYKEGDIFMGVSDDRRNGFAKGY